MTDAVDVLDRVLAARGGRSFVSELAAIESIDDDAAEAICDRVLAIAAGLADPGPGAPGAHPRDLYDDFGEVLYVVARRCPRRFVDVVAADPGLRVSTSVLGALGSVDSPEAAAILIDAVQIRRAGHTFTRWSALGSLVALGHPQLPDLLVTLVRDRDGLVRFSAVEAAITYGDARLIGWLRRLAEAERTPPGTREYAWDAIEAITVREGLTDVAWGPDGRRLVAVLAPPGTRTGVIDAVPYRFDTVSRGEVLAVMRAGNRSRRVLAPCDGTVVSARPRVGRPVSPVLFWIRRQR